MAAGDALKRTPKAGPGRPKGSRNKLTISIKQMIEEALSASGGVDYLVRQAKANPTAFLTLVGKILPLQVTGANGGPIEAIWLPPPPAE